MIRGRGRGSGSLTPAFAPTDIANLQLWLDASDASTITQVAGAVSQWNDKSGNGNHATQGTGSSQPITGTRTIGGLNALDFDGSNDFMSLTSSIAATSGITCFAVCEADTVAAQGAMITGSASGSPIFQTRTSTPNFAWVTWGVAERLGTSAISSATPYLVAGRSSAAGSNLYASGLAAASNATNPAYSAPLTGVGGFSAAGLNFNGKIASVLVYDRVLSNSEMNQIGAYLSTKWGTTWSDI
jgi:hypothetical protein